LRPELKSTALTRKRTVSKQKLVVLLGKWKMHAQLGELVGFNCLAWSLAFHLPNSLNWNLIQLMIPNHSIIFPKSN
jgi:hypothetical protein